MEENDEPRLDRTAFSDVELGTPSDDLAYWLTKTPQERIAHQEYLRQCVYGKDYAKQGLQRVLEFDERKQS